MNTKKKKKNKPPKNWGYQIKLTQVSLQYVEIVEWDYPQMTK